MGNGRFLFLILFRLEWAEPDTLFSMANYYIWRNHINFPNSKLGFSLRIVEAEYKNLISYVEHFVFFLQQHKRTNGYARKLFEDRETRF